MRIGLTHLRTVAAWLRLRPAVANAVAVPGAITGIEPSAPSAALKSFAGALSRNLAAEEERWLGWCVFAFGSGSILATARA
jgi:hypothetical protein